MAQDGYLGLQEDSLFFTLAEDLKTPLVRIAYQAELTNASDIQTTAQDVLRLLDAYLLSTKSQAQFELEPANPSAVLVDVAHELSKYAERFGCQVTVSAHIPHMTALLHRKALQSALSAIGIVFIEAQGILGIKKGIELATYKSKNGIAVGVFQNYGMSIISAQLLSRARTHLGDATRPFAGLASGAAAQLFVAEQLVQGMHSTLRSARRGKQTGLAADLLPSNQLLLV